jgi:hypothetical protein
MAGLGSAAAAGAAIHALDLLFSSGARPGRVVIRAVGGLPEQPPPNYASYVLEGHVDVAGGPRGSRGRCSPATPGIRGDIVLPGLTRTIQITDMRQVGGAYPTVWSPIGPRCYRTRVQQSRSNRSTGKGRQGPVPGGRAGAPVVAGQEGTGCRPGSSCRGATRLAGRAGQSRIGCVLESNQGAGSDGPTAPFLIGPRRRPSARWRNPRR